MLEPESTSVSVLPLMYHFYYFRSLHLNFLGLNCRISLPAEKLSGRIIPLSRNLPVE